MSDDDLNSVAGGAIVWYMDDSGKIYGYDQATGETCDIDGNLIKKP